MLVTITFRIPKDVPERLRAELGRPLERGEIVEVIKEAVKARLGIVETPPNLLDDGTGPTGTIQGD